MNNEQNTVYQLETEIADLDPRGLLKPYAYQRLIARLSERHLRSKKMDLAAFAPYGLAWVLVSMTIDDIMPSIGYQQLLGYTWHSGNQGPFFRREYMITDENGALLFQGASFSVLLDLNKRSIFRSRDLPIPLMPALDDHRVKASATRKAHLDWRPCGTRRVEHSWIDSLGHVNNSRYAELAYDAFTESERSALVRLRRIELYFVNELRAGETIQMMRCTDDQELHFQGLNQDRDNTAFHIHLTFSEPN